MAFDYKRMMQFEHNVGDKDKKIRITVGAVLLVLSIFTAKILLLLVGLVLVATGYFSWCPVYSGFGKNTCATDTGATAEAPPEETTEESKKED